MEALGGPKSRDGCNGGRGRSWGWGILREGEVRRCRITAVPGRKEEGCKHAPLPGPCPNTRSGVALTRAVSAATAPVRAPLLNPEPAERERPAALAPSPPPRAGPKRLRPRGGRGRGGAWPDLQPADPSPPHHSHPWGEKPSCSFRICTWNNIQVSLRVPEAGRGTVHLRG